MSARANRNVRDVVIWVGQAGWGIPSSAAAEFSGSGTHLERYARRFAAVEINSTFYRRHKPATFERWRSSVPADFRFAVKIPKAITHAGALRAGEPLEEFLTDIAPLKEKQGPLLVQLPPRLAFDGKTAGAFFEKLRSLHDGHIACEPRHESWFGPKAEALLKTFHVARVAADPARGLPNAHRPGGWEGFSYFRLHGSPQTYYSNYPDAYLRDLADTLVQRGASAPVWCIFDNTAAGAAARNALRLLELLKEKR